MATFVPSNTTTSYYTDTATVPSVSVEAVNKCSSLTGATIVPQIVVIILVIIVLVLIFLSWYWRRPDHNGSAPTNDKVKTAGYMEIGAMIVSVAAIIAAIWGVFSASKAKNACDYMARPAAALKSA